MELSFAVFDHIHLLPEEWQLFAQDKKALSTENIGVQDYANIENLRSYYLLVKERQEIVFIIYFQLLSVKPIHFNLGEKKQQQFWLDLALNIVKPTLLVAGNLFRHDESFFKFSDVRLRKEQEADIYQQAVNFMVKHTNASGIFLKDVPSEIAGHISKDPSYHALQDDISMEIVIPAHWHSLCDYEKDLKHKYLQRSKKMRKSFADIQARELNKAELQHYSQDIYRLYQQVTRKQIVSMGMLNEHFFIELKKALKDHYRVCGFFLDGKLIAFSSAIRHEGIYDMNYIGIDYQFNQSHHLYFNILFHCLESAILAKASKLILGRTAIEAKAIMGCTPDYRFSFYKLRNVIVNWFYQRVSKYFSESQGDKWKDRHPFKSMVYENT
ncbi:MAG: GNAT family N-acetyltransferase [Chitinophagaceae bacterium]|nr:GNAT family N-acetyltransferase [Chitinophagaceae bacterium]